MFPYFANIFHNQDFPEENFHLENKLFMSSRIVFINLTLNYGG